MATIQALAGQTVHQIQSGQVIVDLCSVVKELLENSIDAGAKSIEVRFKDHGLGAIEVQDNGAGIAPENYESLALKHHTSKLRSYDDLTSLDTFGFRGEALSSLCALSKFHVVTARESEAPKGTRLEFATSGKLDKTQITAAQKGTTAVVEALFYNLPVRRRELEKNIKREYGKVLGILQAYACINTTVRLSISNTDAKGKKAVAFATKSNSSTRDNIAHVFGSKVMGALIPMDLKFSMQPSKDVAKDSEDQSVRVQGQVSRPSHGEGRNTPDRQMFFVNGRPCGLPQVAKVFNEVYKSFNMNQSPFVLSNILLNTNAYDVNVSPDKRTILLHDQSELLASLRDSLTALFEDQDHIVPQSQRPPLRQPHLPAAFRSQGSQEDSDLNEESSRETRSKVPSVGLDPHETSSSASYADLPSTAEPVPFEIQAGGTIEGHDESQNQPAVQDSVSTAAWSSVMEMAPVAGSQMIPSSASESHARTQPSPGGTIISPQKTRQSPGIVPNAFDRMRPRRSSPEVALITIGDKTTSEILGNGRLKRRRSPTTPEKSRLNGVSQRMRNFAAPGSGSVTLFETTQPRTRRQERIDESKSLETDPDEDPESSGVESDPVQPDEDEQKIDSDDEMSDGFSAKKLNRATRDDDYVDDGRRRDKDEAQVSHLIEQAEASSTSSRIDQQQRAYRILRGSRHKDQTLNLEQTVDVSSTDSQSSLRSGGWSIQSSNESAGNDVGRNLIDTPIDSAHPTLVIAKQDFAQMHIAGQFNLGFILATRNGSDLFIIDQHASDEKYNFERIQRTTQVQNQRLVHPHRLELTAVDEELILENQDAMLKNGFGVEIDVSGDHPVGRRCQLVSLPMSKGVTFTTTDLDELISLLADHQPHRQSHHRSHRAEEEYESNEDPHRESDHHQEAANSTSNDYNHDVPRPSKIRRMFAMRACRSSVMIGKTLTRKQMEVLVRHMGQIDKPWNCPHGRPTMRHVCGLNDWTAWREGDGLVADHDDDNNDVGRKARDVDGKLQWAKWLAQQDEEDGENGEEEEEEQEYDEEDDDEPDGSDKDSEEDGGDADEDGDLNSTTDYQPGP